MNTKALLISLGMMMLAFPATASAQQRPEGQATSTKRQDMAVDLHASLGGPQGYVGASWTTFADRPVALTLGGGWGHTGYGGSFMPRLQWVSERWIASLGAGAGLYTMDYVQSPLLCCGDDEHFKADAVLWLNAEANLIYRHPEGWRVGAYLGMTRQGQSWNMRSKLIGSATEEFVPTNSGPFTKGPLPYLGLSLGTTF